MMNSFQVGGRLTRDVAFTPKIDADTPNNSDRAWGRIANEEAYRPKDGKPHVNFFNFSCFGVNARNVAKYTEKGKVLYITGSLRHRTVGEGSERKEYTEIKAERIDFGPSAKKNQPGTVDTDGLAKRIADLEAAASRSQQAEPAEAEAGSESNPF